MLRDQFGSFFRAQGSPKCEKNVIFALFFPPESGSLFRENGDQGSAPPTPDTLRVVSIKTSTWKLEQLTKCDHIKWIDIVMGVYLRYI